MQIGTRVYVCIVAIEEEYMRTLLAMNFPCSTDYIRCIQLYIL